MRNMGQTRIIRIFIINIVNGTIKFSSFGIVCQKLLSSVAEFLAILNFFILSCNYSLFTILKYILYHAHFTKLKKIFAP